MRHIYKIADWQARFETSETRKLETLKWWPKPNKHDGLGFRLMVDQRDRVELFCAWNLIADIASKTTPKEDRGKLMRQGQPLDASDMAVITGFPKPIFEKALEFFSNPKPGWIVKEIFRESPYDTAATGPVPGGAPGSPADSPGDSCNPMSVLKGTEGKGIEENGKKEKESASRFSPPSFAELQLLGAKMGLPETEVMKFFHFYESKGWKVGKNPMKSLCSTMTGWKLRWEETRSRTHAKPESLRTELDRLKAEFTHADDRRAEVINERMAQIRRELGT